MSQYQIDNGLTIIRNFGATVAHLLAAVVLYSTVMQMMLSKALVDDDDDLSLIDRITINLATLYFRVFQELFGLYNPMSIIDFFGMGNPIQNLFISSYKYAERAIQIGSASEEVDPEMKERIEKVSGKTFEQMEFENWMMVMPGGPGIISTEKMLNGKYASLDDMNYLYDQNMFAAPLYKKYDLATNPNSLYNEDNFLRSSRKRENKRIQ